LPVAVTGNALYERFYVAGSGEAGWMRADGGSIMLRGIRIARIFGIDVSIHPSWFVILFLIVWSLGSGLFPSIYAGWSQGEYWGVAVAAAMLLFASVLAHELAHSLVARRQGVPVTGITLFLLGGVSNLERESDTPGREALMAAAGPAMSVLLGGIFWGAGALVETPQTVRGLLLYLGLINLALAAFNLLPGFPLDGGRVLRAGLWRARRDFLWATRVASRVSIVVGLALIAYGIVMAFLGSIIGGLWLAFIGWTIIVAAQASYRQTVAQRALAGLRVGDVMSSLHGFVPPDASLEEVAERSFGESDSPCLPVGDQERLDGVVCQADVLRQHRASQRDTTVRDVMIGRDELPEIGPDAPASDALQLLMSRGVDQLAVMDGERLTGFVDRGRLLRYARFPRSRRGRNVTAPEVAGEAGQAPLADADRPPEEDRRAA
jgi:Zn-dependent protease